MKVVHPLSHTTEYLPIHHDSACDNLTSNHVDLPMIPLRREHPSDEVYFHQKTRPISDQELQTIICN